MGLIPSYAWIQADSSSDGADLYLQPNTGGYSYNTILNLNGGKVGIGTSSPVNKLDVEGSAVIGATYSGTNTAPTNGLLVEGNVGIGMITPNAKLAISGGNIALNGGWLSRDGNNEGVFVASDGNVGVGTASTPEKLTVSGDIVASDIKATGTLFVDYVQQFTPRNGGGNGGFCGGAPAGKMYYDSVDDHLWVCTGNNVARRVVFRYD